MTTLDALIMNMLDQDIGVTERFLVDTGAAFSVLNGKYEKLFKQAKQVDTIKVQYGSGSPRNLPVFDAKLKVKHIEAMPLKIAIDRNLKTRSLLGNVDFIDRFRSIAIVNNKKRVHFFL
ncbi:MAG: hypothetical protein GY797_04780 [Deltaproteobacteria bacterium]|nr:hypothetical protein [Deltaproteobacteria bacterium]